MKLQTRGKFWFSLFGGLLFCSALIFTPIFTPSADAQSPVQELGKDEHDRFDQLIITRNLEERIDFWILIFTQYGKNQLVFHHRQHPHIIYSVLDFSELAARYSGAEFERRKTLETENETRRIQEVLRALADGKDPQTQLERRLKRLFQGLTRFGWGVKSLYREAATDENLRTQTGIKEKFLEGLIRSRRYMYAIEEIFRSAGLPVELSRMPHIESSFDYTAYSSVGAAGIWQFMPATGRAYMRIDNLVDERRDPITASRAAAHYLRHAYSRTNSWPMAVTSYNHGLTGILRAAKGAGSKDMATIIRKYDGKSFGFASKNFYPELVAAIEIDRDWQRYFPGAVLEKPVFFDEIIIGDAVNISRVAKASGVSVDRIVEMNPAFLKPVSSGRIAIPSGVTVKVPNGKGPAAVSRLPRARLAVLTELPTPKRVTASKSKRSVKRAAPKKSSAKKSSKKSAATKSNAKKSTKKKSSEKKSTRSKSKK